MRWEHREPPEGLANPDEDGEIAGKRGRDPLRPVFLEKQHLCLTKPRRGEVETEDTRIRRGETVGSSLSYIKTPSKAEARGGVERSLLARTEAIGERGGGVEVSILPATVWGGMRANAVDSLRKVGGKS